MQKPIGYTLEQNYKIAKGFIVVLVASLFLWGCQAQRPRKAYKIGKAAFEKEEYIRAIEWLTQAINSKKNQFNDAYIYRGKSYLALNRKKEAVQDFINATKLHPKNPDIAIEAAKTFYNLKEYNRALQYATITLDRDSANFEAMKIQALTLTYTGSAESSLILCDKAAEINEDAELLYAKAMASDSLNLIDYAIAYYKQAIDSNKTYQPPYHALGRLFAKNGYYDKAIDIFTKSAKQFNDSESFRLRAILFETQGQRKAQINDVTKILTLNPTRVELFFQRAILFKKENLLKNALSDINNYLKWDSLSSSALLLKGEILEELHIDRDAIEIFEKILLYSPIDSDIILAKKAIHRLKQENYPPQVKITSPIGYNDTTIILSENEVDIKIKGIITDKSEVSCLEINKKKIDFQKTDKSYTFSHQLKADSISKFQIKTTDIYNNTSKITYHIQRAEKDVPQIYLTSPVINNDSSIVAKSQKIEITGFVEEKSTLKGLNINGKSITFRKKADKYFFKDAIDIINIDTLEIKAVDYFLNHSTYKFPITLSDSIPTKISPLGKTWLVLITSDTINNKPIKPIAQHRDSLLGLFSRFNIDSILTIQNATKKQLERSLIFDLPKEAKNQRVEAIVIYFIGPGMTYNDFSYWIVNSKKTNKKYDLLNTSILRTVNEAFNFVRFQTVVSESVQIGKNIIETKEGLNNASCNNMKRYPDEGQFFIGIKVENWNTYHSKVGMLLKETFEQNKNCFTPSNKLLQQFNNVSFGVLKDSNKPMFPVIIFTKQQ